MVSIEELEEAVSAARRTLDVEQLDRTIATARRGGEIPKATLAQAQLERDDIRGEQQAKQREVNQLGDILHMTAPEAVVILKAAGDVSSTQVAACLQRLEYLCDHDVQAVIDAGAVPAIQDAMAVHRRCERTRIEIGVSKDASPGLC
jgi:hypothetical protein